MTTLDARVRDRRSPPDSEYLSLVEATSFLAFGEFLGSDDLETVLRDNAAAVGLWSDASDQLLRMATAGRLTFRGRKARNLSADPKPERKKIHGDFFTGKRKLVVGLTDTFYDKENPKRRLYYDVIVRTDEFKRAFLTAKPAKRGGSKPLYDWRPFITEAVQQLEQEGDFCLGWRQGDLETHMAKWCFTKWEKVPSEARIRTKVKEAREEFLRQRAQG